MANMAYCRMQNTYPDLRDCVINWDDADSDDELKYRRKIVTLAKQIVEEHGDEN